MAGKAKPVVVRLHVVNKTVPIHVWSDSKGATWAFGQAVIATSHQGVEYARVVHPMLVNESDA